MISILLLGEGDTRRVHRGWLRCHAPRAYNSIQQLHTRYVRDNLSRRSLLSVLISTPAAPTLANGKVDAYTPRVDGLSSCSDRHDHDFCAGLARERVDVPFIGELTKLNLLLVSPPPTHPPPV